MALFGNTINTARRVVSDPSGLAKEAARNPVKFGSTMVTNTWKDMLSPANTVLGFAKKADPTNPVDVSDQGVKTAQELANNQMAYANQFNAPFIESANMNQSREQFLNALNLQEKAALGQTPSVAQLQQQQGLEQALQAQLAAANSARGGRGAQIAAARNAAMQGGAMQQGLINQAAQLRAQEMAQARDAYLQGYGNLFNQDTGIATNRANLIAGNQQMKLNALQSANQLQSQAANNLAQMQAQAQMAANQNKSQMLGGLLNAGGAVGAAAVSDEDAKTNIDDAHSEMENFLKSLSVKKYEYKDKRDGQGTFISPMAQDLEKSKAGKKMVKTAPDGKKLVQHDAHSLSMILSALGHLNDKIEGRA